MCSLFGLIDFQYLKERRLYVNEPVNTSEEE